MTPKNTDAYTGEERRSAARETRPFGLVRYFSIASAAAFVGAIALVATLQFWTSKNDLVRLAEIETVGLGQTVSNSAWPEISRFLEMTSALDDETLRSRPETGQIHTILQQVTRGLPVMKIKIYDLDGRTVFSTDRKEIGQDKSANPGFLSAAKQRKPASRLSHKGSISAFSGVLFNRDVVETYLPVYGPSGAVEGVFELYTDVSRTIGAVHGMVREIVLIVVAAFALLYLLLYLIVRRADRILHAQSVDIDFKSAALAARNVDLEREINERKQIESRLEGAVQSLQEAFAFFDADDRLVFCNDEYKRMHPLGREIVKPGVKFEDIIRANVERGNIADAIGREEEFIRDRLARHRNPGNPVVRRLTDGRSIILYENRTPDGGTCLTMTDVTDLKRAGDALRESERALRAIIDSVPAMVSTKDRDSRYIFMNKYQADLYGTTPADAVGKTATDFLGPEYGQSTRIIDVEVLTTNRGRYNYEEHWVDAAGRAHDLLTTKVPLADDAGNPTGIVTVALDVSDRRKLEEAVEAERRRLEEAIESIEGGAIIYDADDRIVLCNRTYRKHLGEIEEVLVPGARFDDVIRAIAEAGIVDEAIADPERYVRDRIARHRALQPSLLHMTNVDRWYLLREYRTSDGGTLIIRTDVTEQKRAEEALRASEERFRSVTQSINDAIIAIDDEGHIIQWNEGARHAFGYEEREALGEPLLKLIPERYRQRHTDAMERVKRTGETRLMGRTLELSGLSKDGGEFPVELSLGTWTSAGKTYFSGIVRDITERKKAEEALRASEERFKDIAESALDWFWEMGPDLRFTFVSDRYFERTGLHPEDIIGKTRQELVGRELIRENPEMWRAHEKTLRNHESFSNFEYSQRDADGSICHVRVSGKPFFDDDGAFLGYRGATTDITDYRRAERELAHHKRMESLGNLAGGIAHNLNNLLQPILILSDLTGQALPKSSVERQNLAFISDAGNRAKELIDRVLAFSREKFYDFKTADIYDVVREELKLIYSVVPSSITINENLVENSGTVLVDVLQTQTVLMNIVANAVDAMEGGPGRLDVSLTRARVGTGARDSVPNLPKGDYAKLTIGDDGPGMDEKTLGRIFDPFFTTKPPGKGAGLGLSTAFGIVVKHGGTIRASSTPGKGTTFDVYLPLEGSKSR